jgi:hypothetical protein
LALTAPLAAARLPGHADFTRPEDRTLARHSTAASLVALLALLAATNLASAAPAGFQVEIQGTGSQLGANTGIAQINSVSDVFAPQFGFSLGATYGFTEHLVFGVRGGSFAERKDVTEFAHEANLLPAGLTATQELQVIPLHGLLQYRARLGKKFGVYDELGVGVSSFKLRQEAFRDGQSLARFALYQKNLSFLIGGGASWDYQTAFSVLASFDVLMVPSANGDVWSTGDNPHFWMVSLGIRYPRR